MSCPPARAGPAAGGLPRAASARSAGRRQIATALVLAVLAGALLLAGGVGGLAIGAWALSLTGAATAWVVRRSTALFVLTSAVNVVTVIPAALVWWLTGHGGGLIALLGACGLLGVAAGAALRASPSPLPRREPRRRRRRRPAWPGHVGAGVHDAWRIVLAPDWRLAGALGYLWFDIAALWAVFMATGDVPPLAALVLGYLIGQLANAAPVPGDRRARRRPGGGARALRRRPGGRGGGGAGLPRARKLDPGRRRACRVRPCTSTSRWRSEHLTPFV